MPLHSTLRSLVTRYLALALSLAASLPAAQAGPGSVFYEAPGDGAATLRQQSGSLQLIDSANRVLATVPVSEIGSGVVIRGMGHAFSLTVDVSVQTLPGGIHFEGGSGKAVLIGPGRKDVSWHLTGPSAGDLIDPAFVTFSGISDLIGAADNEDIFVIAGGTLPGVVDGGPRGYDTMVIEGSYDSVVMGATAGDSGWVDLDGRRVDYDGLEPVNLGGPVADLTLDLSGLADFGVLEATANPGQMQLRTKTFTAETQLFQAPTNSLTVRLGGNDDTLEVDSLAANFAANLTIDGQGEVDTVILKRPLDLHGGILTIIAEFISPTIVASITPASPSNFGQALILPSVTLTNPTGPAPTGNVSVFETTGGTDVPIAGLTNVPATSISNADMGSFPAGTRVFRIDYLGDANYAPGSLTLTQVVAPAVTTATITSSISGSSPSGTAIIGADVTLRITVSAASGGLPPTGLVQVRDNTTNTVLGNGIENIALQTPTSRTYEVNVAAAQFTVGGTHDLAAEYTSGSGNFANHTSANFALNIVSPPSLVVTTANDSTPGTPTDYDGLTSLREAIAYASTLGGTPEVTFSDGTGGTINFFDGTSRTIVLSAELLVSAPMTITGPGANRLAVSGNNAVRVFRIAAPVTLSGMTVTSGNSSGLGGAGILGDASITLWEMVISGNLAGSAGGGILMSTAGSALTMINCTVSGNAVTGTFNGGGVQLNSGGSHVFINSTVSGNTGNSGGGIRATAGLVTLTNCTITGNTPTTDGGGISNTGATVTVANTIIAGNQSPGAVDVHGAFTSSGGNLIGSSDGLSGFTNGVNGDLVGTAISPIDPMLEDLADFGGSTPTRALKPGSPAINSGLTANVPTDSFDLDGDTDTGEPLPFDQRGAGFPRAHGTMPVDIGAVESNAIPLASNGTATATTGDQTTFTLPATDADGDLLTITGTTPDSHLTVDATSGLDVTITAASNFAGDATLGYTVSDGLGGTASGTITVTIADNDAPTITAPPGGFSPLIFFAGPMPDFRGDVSTGDNISVTSVTQDPPQDSVVDWSDLPVTVTLTAHDAAGNTADLTFSVSIRPASAESMVHLAQGDTAPGVGTNGLPADAKLVSFQSPAVDDAGAIALIAKWTSATGGGTGLFFDDQCLAITPGDPPVSGASYRSFTDPVVDDGKVACIATLGGVPPAAASVVLSNAATAGDLEVIARAGDIAPIADGTQPATGAKFKTFKAVALADGAIGIFAQLTGGTGEEKATAATDLGLWIKEGSGPLRLALREGQKIATSKFIKTLTSFGVGAGSPGQGRGWVERISGEPAVLARVVYTDKTQAVLSARLASGDITVTTVIDTATILPPAALVTGLGLPAINANGEFAILASTASETGPRPGVVVKRPGTSFVRTAVTRAASPLAGTTFASIKDPVLAPDGSIAFPATIKGATVKGTAMQTIWWEPVGQPLTLLAQGGTDAGDLAGAKWKAFTSIAIAGGRGPVFAATLVPNKTNVSKASATGVWACDFNGDPRLLFRTGDQIDIGVPGTPLLKKLKSFTLLKATVGSTGVTRSFNHTAQVAWLATFTDKSQAIVMTDVP